MESYYNGQLRKQIMVDGSNWVAQQNFWLFGTATYYDGTIMSRDEVVRDTKYFFNMLDRKILSRKDFDENRRLERLVFIESGKNRNNLHLHFFIKGKQWQDYKQIKQLSESLWSNKIKKGYNMTITDNIDKTHERKGYCWKEIDNLNTDILLVECCHTDTIK